MLTVRSRRLALMPAAAFALVVSVPREARAQEQRGYASNHFQPSERGSRWFVLDSLDIEGNGRLALGVVNDYSYRSLVDYRPDGGSARDSVVRNQFITHLGASMMIAERFRIGASVPLQLFADGHTATINGVSHRAAEDVSVGDVRLAVDARLLGATHSPAILALGSEVYLPSGSPSAYTGDGKPRVLPRVLFAGETSNIAYAARVGFQIRERNEAWGDGQIGSGFVFAASAGALLLDKKLIVGPEIFGSTVTANDRAFDNRTTPIEALLGAHYDLGTSNLRVGASQGVGLTRGYGAAVYRALLSLEWVPGDAKPEAPPPAKAGPDHDGDGVPDCEDACAYAAGPKSTDPAKNGCPLPDADGDGIPDAEDACPHEAGPRTSDPTTSGCALKAVEPAPAPPPPPPNPDRDGDGIPNDADACPDEPGKADPDPKKNGCPMAFVEGNTIKILEQVKFKTASAEIVAGKDSEDILNAVASVLKARPEITRVRIEGHTDDRGDAANNKTLSLARAKSVVKWLTDHGVAASRLSAEGFGSEKPRDTNSTDAGRTNNRRVEFHIEQGNGGNR